MKVKSTIASEGKLLSVENDVKYQEVEITISDCCSSMHISVDGPTLIKAIQNAMND